METNILEFSIDRNHRKFRKILEVIDPFTKKEKNFMVVKEIGNKITCKLATELTQAELSYIVASVQLAKES